MSIEAMNWAFAQQELKPATKLVLIYLANCHNTYTKRCDPAQATMAEHCCMARSTLNEHLGALERLGLIRRIQRSDKRTKRQERTLYILGCDGVEPQDEGGSVSGNRTRESGKAVSGNRTRGSGKAVSGKSPKPCPENSQSRVRLSGHKPESNPKGTNARARTREGAQGAKPFFTDDERRNAREIAKAVSSGVFVNPSGIRDRWRDCMLAEKMITEEQAKRLGIG